LTENFNLRLTKDDLALLVKISRMRGQSPSDFLRLALRRQFAKLRFLSQEETQALELEEKK